jgi:uncharacterized protein (TIGR01777 family)
MEFRVSQFLHSSEIDVPAVQLDAWHRRIGAFERLSPPWQTVELESGGELEEGARAELRLRMGPFSKRWIALHKDVRPGEGFTDVQEEGPFASWHHTHRFETLDETRSRLVDEIDFRLPLDPLSRIALPLVRKQLDQTFGYRHRVTAHDLDRHSQYPPSPLRIVLSGASGLVGTALAAYLSTAGHTVQVLSRKSKPNGRYPSIPWSVREKKIDAEALEGCDAVIHLAGAPIATRWTPEVKESIRASRVDGTRLLAETIAGLTRPPKVFLSASAIGWYGATSDDQPRTESDPGGEGFLASVVREWEAATAPAEAVTRVAHLRLGVILSSSGGALAKMLPAFQFGAGGPIGNGQQWFSWIALDDLLSGIEHLLHRDDVRGPVNMTAPNPARQRDFARCLGKVLGRPSIAPLPRFVVEALFGEMGKETVLEGLAVRPDRLQEAGFEFAYGDLESALRHTLGRT